ncbi:MAG TPA: dihydrofolate reductase family protein [Candidatus Dormibacteraeota bacterium]|nr:dihydrofolate reductase family protein [Candidatus Dormibacteraeota bacterium]
MASTRAEVELGLDVLLDTREGPLLPLPDVLQRSYGGPLSLRSPCVYANFVESVDGVVALGHEQTNAGSVVSGRNPSDRFVMGLLRACASAVVIGAGTLRATPRHHWTAEHVHPDATELFAELRRRLGLQPAPQLVVVSARGDIPVDHPGLEGALVATTDDGAQRLREHAATQLTVRSFGDAVSLQGLFDELRSAGHSLVLTEGGPTLIGQLLRERLLDDLFLTLSPVLFGRSGVERRVGLVEETVFSADDAPRLLLRDVRRDESFLFIRYAVQR